MGLLGRRRIARRREDPEVRDWAAGRQRTAWLALSLVLVLLPHLPRMPAWIPAIFGAATLWRLAAAWRGTPLPTRGLVSILSVAMLPAVFLSYGTVLGRNAGVALLAVLVGMKLLETRNLRDAYFVGFLAYFLVVTNFLFSQTLLTGVYMLAVVVVMTATLVALTLPEKSARPLDWLRLSGALLAQALPLMVVLFFLFPRMPGPLWGLPKDAHSGVSGLGNTMSPGNISNLGLSDEVAFRATFEGASPPPGQLYWRGPVLWRTDGRTWSPGARVRGTRVVRLGSGSAPMRHTVTLEPHQQRWLFALDVPVEIPEDTYLTEDLQLRSLRPVQVRRRYEVVSQARFVQTRLRTRDRRRALELPVERHPLARALALSWLAAADGDHETVVRTGLEYLREQPFTYTLRPPLLDGDTVDQFLFETRRGFCEHFAASFAVLMRAAGVPTRVVTGYQGGEINPLGDYLIVRQRDAHAWVEVWLDRRGWVRVDPTAAVAPERIEGGMDAAIPRSFGPSGLGIEPSEPVVRLWRRLRHGWDAVNATWNQWVLAYGRARQKTLLESLGMDPHDLLAHALALVAAIAMVLGLVALWLARRPGRRDAAARLYERFCRKLRRRGLIRAPSEGPVDFARRVSTERPALAGAVSRVTELYVALRYGHGGDLRTLRREIAGFRP
jgi:transglutaminase-like putative cysteine protease